VAKNILIIEDEEDIIELVKYNLKKEGFNVYSSKDGEEGLDKVYELNPSLVILDLMLPSIDGLEIAKRIRKDDDLNHIPIIMLTAKSEESDVILGLELGADDYITKPFSPKVLISRIKAVLRRSERTVSKKTVQIRDMFIESNKHKVTLSGKEIILTPTEFKLLEFMAGKPGIVFSRDKLLNSVLGYESVVYDRTVDAHIKSLRKKMGSNKDYIETVHGIGYRFKESEGYEE